MKIRRVKMPSSKCREVTIRKNFFCKAFEGDKECLFQLKHSEHCFVMFCYFFIQDAVPAVFSRPSMVIIISSNYDFLTK